jgi:hypothetical protein
MATAMFAETLNDFSTFNTDRRRKPKLYIELQQLKPKERTIY